MSRTRLVLALGLVAAVLYHCRASAPPRERAVQAAVLTDGFVVKLGSRVLELEPTGQLRREHAFDEPGDVRIAGTRVGPIAGYVSGSKVELALIPDGATETWGKRVRKLCDGVASNDANFAFGWLESDESVWIVFGPVAGAADEAIEAEALRGRDWCGVASAGNNIDLFWRDRDKLQWQVCQPRKGCGGIPMRYDLQKGSPVLGIGCLEDACLIASQDRTGTPQIAYVTNRSKVAWTTRVAATSNIAIAATANGFAVGYTSKDGAVITRYDRKGTATPVWTGATDGPPALAWSKGHLLASAVRDAGLLNMTFSLD
jgi:hypothetical protein